MSVVDLCSKRTLNSPGLEFVRSIFVPRPSVFEGESNKSDSVSMGVVSGSTFGDRGSLNEAQKHGEKGEEASVVARLGLALATD